MPSQSAYIISARRTAIGRIGGLHKNRRIDEMCAPLIGVALQDSGLDPKQVDEFIIGNATAGGNPARLIALAAGLPETTPASTLDRQCGSGLDAVVAAARAVSLGESEAIVAGGAEAISMAPWRVAKPRSMQQLPRFLSFEPGSGEEREGPAHLESTEALAARLGISRAEQDAYVLRSYLKAEQAREAKRFVGEIAPLRSNPEEARDQSSVAPDFKDLAQLAPYLAPDGTLTPGNTSNLHDGASVAVVVSQGVWASLGKPRGLRLLAHATRGTSPEDEAAAPIEAMRKLQASFKGYKSSDIGVVEMSESSAAQAIALMRSLELDDDLLNPDGGAIARGHPFAAASSVLVTRLFTRLARGESKGRGLGIATLGVAGGMGSAALFEAV
ncbi:MAG: thiolase family protein [Hyphomicrobium sp.]|jgi:acetyl-CoA C-acetyltransferase